VTSEQYEQQNKGMVAVADDTVRMLAAGITAAGRDRNGRTRTRVMPGLGIAPGSSAQWDYGSGRPWACASPISGSAPTAPATCNLYWQASNNGRELEPLKHRKAGDFRDIPVPDMIWDMVQQLPGGPLCPGPNGTPYMPCSTAGNRFGQMLAYLGISGVHTHTSRHQFASKALDASPRELANISQVLGHHSIETTLHFCIHASTNAEQRIGAMMNARWTTNPAPASNRA
jgi:hypothetical protein